MRILFSVEGEE